MTEKDRKLLADFELKMRRLMFLCDSLRSENISLKREVADKNKVVEDLSGQLEELKEKYDSLKFAKSFINHEEQEIDLTKKKLAKLVRDIDKCIALLKN